MATIHRRSMKPRPLSDTAQQLLRYIRGTRNDPRTPAQLMAASGIRPGWGWNALVQLQERGFVRLSDDGRLSLTRAGEGALRQHAA